MNSCVSLCLLVAVLAAGVLAQKPQPQEIAPRRDQRAVQRLDGDPRANLGALLARYVQHVRKGTYLPIPPLQLFTSNPVPAQVLARGSVFWFMEGASKILSLRCTRLKKHQKGVWVLLHLSLMFLVQFSEL